MKRRGRTLQVDAAKMAVVIFYSIGRVLEVNAPSVSDYIPHDGRHSHMTVRSCAFYFFPASRVLLLTGQKKRRLVDKGK